MNINISQNIKSYRKKLGITQAQLAEALGVTIGAVSKWESGLSYPDIELIVELADFFEISVDSLLGYEWRSLNIGKTIEKLKEIIHNKQYSIGTREAEKALQKYPNSFYIIYYSAELFNMKGLEQKNIQDLQHAQKLYTHSLDYIEQNDDEEINEVIIQIKIGDILMAMGDMDNAINHLKKYNYCGINSDKIGFYLSQQEKVEEAFPYLSDSSLNVFSMIIRIGMGFANCYATIKEYNTAIDCLLSMNSLVQGIKKTPKICYMDKLSAILFTCVAQLYAKQGEKEIAHQYLDRAKEIAVLFDSAPIFTCSNIKFYRGKEQSAYDDLGESAMLGINNIVTKSFSDEDDLLIYWNKLNGGLK